MLATEPTALQLRYLQTVTEIAAENNSTTIFPIPIEMMRPFMGGMAAAATAVTGARAVAVPKVTGKGGAAAHLGHRPVAPAVPHGDRREAGRGVAG